MTAKRRLTTSKGHVPFMQWTRELHFVHVAPVRCVVAKAYPFLCEVRQNEVKERLHGEHVGNTERKPLSEYLKRWYNITAFIVWLIHTHS
jgi:hypothetical protein